MSSQSRCSMNDFYPAFSHSLSHILFLDTREERFPCSFKRDISKSSLLLSLLCCCGNQQNESLRILDSLGQKSYGNIWNNLDRSPITITMEHSVISHGCLQSQIYNGVERIDPSALIYSIPKESIMYFLYLFLKDFIVFQSCGSFV